ncbi:hypothetical protein PVAP13_4KG149000, partial [Panicum virgatum]
MAGATMLQLQERVLLPRTAWKLADLAVLSLLLALLAHRAASLLAVTAGGAAPACTWCWLAALVCEAWFTVVWLLTVNGKWNPVRIDELPAVDMFLLALDYPAGKLACYVSDDGCSPLTCFALREAAEFARLWVPFCRKHGVSVRAPFVYFSSSSGAGARDDEFQRDWTAMKSEYEKLVSRIENADEESLARRGDGEFAEFVGAECRNHPTIIKVLRDSGKAGDGNGIPSLIYISREKSPRHQHHFKAGAMNVLTRVPAVLTNAPIMLNVDCDNFANNPQIALHAMCLLLGFDDEVQSCFAQAPEKVHGALKDDPFGNQMEVFYEKLGFGIAGLQGMFYFGTGCFHRRKVIYGVPPESTDVQPTRMRVSPSHKELQKMFGSSKELIESVRSTISGEMFVTVPMVDLASRTDVAKEVSASSYEAATSWGQEVTTFCRFGLVYGSVAEDILTGQRIHAAGWRSALMNINPPAFLGDAPTGGPASLTQYKRWATGLQEIILNRNNPILLCISKHLEFRQCLAYLVLDVWPLRVPFELCYTLLGPCCLLANRSFLPKVTFCHHHIILAETFSNHTECRLSARAWWNNHRMQRIVSSSAWLLAFLTVVLKTLGLSETVFDVTCKEQDGAPDGGDPERFTFDSSPVFIPPTALTILTVVAIAVGGVAGAAGGPGVGEFVCCGWLVLCFWPFVRWLAGMGSYAIPWSVRIK